MLRGLAARCALCAAAMACGQAARAQTPPPAPASAGAAATKTAGKLFAEGEKAFAAGDFTRAAAAFEDAFALAPHPDALWNAARSWERAGDSARAATLYQRWLDQAAPDASDRAQAEASLAALASTLGRLIVTAPDGAGALRVDGRPVARGVAVFVSPGEHEIQGRLGGRENRRTVVVAAGASVAVSLPVDEPPAPVPPAAPTLPPAPPVHVVRSAGGRAGDAPPARRGWSPAVVWISGGATLLSAGWTVWSGLDTLDARDAYVDTPDAKKTQAQLDDGNKRQVRTNLLLGLTTAGAAFTGVVAAFVVDWGGARDGPRAAVGVGPGTVALSGCF